MKIAVFTDHFLDSKGGIVSSVSAQKASLEKLGHEVVIFSPGWHESNDETIVVIPTCKVFKFNHVPTARRPGVIEKWILKNYSDFKKFDLVHVHYEAGCSIAGIRLAKKFKIPIVQTMHGREDAALATNIPFPFKTLVGSALNWFHSWYLPHSMKVEKDYNLAPTVGRAKMWTMMVNHANYADVVITPSSHFADKLKNYGVEKPVKVVSNGIDDDLLKGMSSNEHKWSKDKPLKMIWNSRLSHEKRIMPFLRALRLLDFDFRLQIFGDGNQLKEAKNFVRICKLNSKVSFYGYTKRSKIFNYMADSDLAVMSSYGFDTQGMTLLEAESIGLPVFYCDPDMAEIIPKAGGVLADGPSSKQIAKALNDLAKTPEKFQEMSKIMLKHRKEVLQSTQIKNLLKIYESLV